MNKPDPKESYDIYDEKDLYLYGNDGGDILEWLEVSIQELKDIEKINKKWLGIRNKLIKQLYEFLSMSPSEIGKRVGMSRQMVHRIIKD